MLHHLAIQNFALVDKLNLELGSGMTVVSGETGAGKSIMLDALALTLGNRADAGTLGPHADKTEISASFDVSNNPDAEAWLTEHDAATEEAECILRRVINKDGRSRAFINGVPSTLADIKALGELLADIHSQHEHQSLLKKDTHRKLLDEFSDAESLALEVKAIAKQYGEKQKQLANIISNSEEQTARFQLLSYQLEELEQLGLKANEVADLESEQKRLANGETILNNCQTAIGLCKGEDEGSAIERVSQALNLLSSLDQSELKSIVEMIESAQIQLDEAMQDLEHFCMDFDLDPGRLKEVEARLSAIYEISRKHRVDPSDVHNLTSELSSELEGLKDLDSQTELLESELQALMQRYTEKASELSKIRKTSGKKIQSSVTKRLASLGMDGAKFVVELSDRNSNEKTKGEPHPNGFEDIEFLISTNPGQAPKSLNKIASGGELSRISLAIQVTTAGTSRVPCLVFDEVDVGIGGATAEVVGELLRTLGKSAQIICVTHLAQVAAQGHQHLTVAKSSKGKATTSKVTHLNESERIEEIARMMGGIDQTKQSLAHATEMFESAQAN